MNIATIANLTHFMGIIKVYRNWKRFATEVTQKTTEVTQHSVFERGHMEWCV